MKRQSPTTLYVPSLVTPRVVVAAACEDSFNIVIVRLVKRSPALYGDSANLGNDYGDKDRTCHVTNYVCKIR